MTLSTAGNLRLNREKILSTWQKRAYEEISSALGQTQLARRNSLGDLLTKIEEGLSQTDTGPVYGKSHGLDRAGTLNYSIDQVIYEYHILREVIFEILEEDKDLNKIERNFIIAVIENAVNVSATKFSDTLREIRECYVSTMTHDLKTPVTAAMLSAALILRKPNDANLSQKSAAHIIANLRRLERMIGEILDSSLIGAGEKLELHLSDFDFDALLEEIVDTCNQMFNHRFVYQSLGHMEVFWDRDAFKRVLENLTNNAIKYSYARSIIIINAEMTNDIVKFSIHNESDPIPLEKQSIIFQQHRRIRNATKEKGWGLGLLVTKSLVENHQGKISLESTKEKGTTFTIEVPRIAKVESKPDLPREGYSSKYNPSTQVDGYPLSG